MDGYDVKCMLDVLCFSLSVVNLFHQLSHSVAFVLQMASLSIFEQQILQQNDQSSFFPSLILFQTLYSLSLQEPPMSMRPELYHEFIT
jgi:type III secretory pathway component EscV